MSKIVLCVDDSVTMQQVADITFRGTEYQYVGARTVDEGVSKAKAQKPAVVLADAGMTGKNGYDLCLALKSDPSTADVPVVILVGNSAPYDAGKGAQVGVAAHIGRVTGSKRGTVIGKAENALALAQQRARQTPLLFEGDAFRRQRDALDQVEASQDPRNM